MSEIETGENATLVDPTAGEVVNYNAPPNFRTGDAGALEDGDLLGEETPDEKAAADKPDDTTEAEKKASEAGKALNERKGSLVDDVKNERERRKAAESLAAEQQRILDSWQPILAKLEGRPDLQQAVMTGQISIAKAEATKDREDRAELEEIAADMGYVKADGTTPDLDRAERYRARHLKWAKQTAASEVQPYAKTTEQRTAMDRVEQAVAYAQKHGDADPEIVRDYLTKVAVQNPSQLLDDNSGNWMYDRCVAMTVRSGKGGKATARAAAAPVDRTFVETETPGGRHTGPKLTAQERALGEQFGITDKDWEKAEAHTGRTRGYSSLE